MHRERGRVSYGRSCSPIPNLESFRWPQGCTRSVTFNSTQHDRRSSSTTTYGTIRTTGTLHLTHTKCELRLIISQADFPRNSPLDATLPERLPESNNHDRCLRRTCYRCPEPAILVRSIRADSDADPLCGPRSQVGSTASNCIKRRRCTRLYDGHSCPSKRDSLNGRTGMSVLQSARHRPHHQAVRRTFLSVEKGAAWRDGRECPSYCQLTEHQCS